MRLSVVHCKCYKSYTETERVCLKGNFCQRLPIASYKILSNALTSALSPRYLGWKKHVTLNVSVNNSKCLSGVTESLLIVLCAGFSETAQKNISTLLRIEFFCLPGFCSSLQRQPSLKITVTHFQAKHSQNTLFGNICYQTVTQS